MMLGMDVLVLAQSAFALFAIVDPVGVIPLFLLATRGYSLAQSRAAARLAAITPPGMRAVIDITLTDEPPLAQAVVIITALPAG